MLTSPSSLLVVVVVFTLGGSSSFLAFVCPASFVVCAAFAVHTLVAAVAAVVAF